jgi:hypothetical protein
MNEEQVKVIRDAVVDAQYQLNCAKDHLAETQRRLKDCLLNVKIKEARLRKLKQGLK